MSLAILSEAPPLKEDSSGAIRVGGTRVLLDLVIEAYQDGATPESIVQAYPTLPLSDVYSVIGYYLRHPKEIDDYLARREVQAEATRAKIEAAQPDLQEIRKRIAAARGR